MRRNVRVATAAALAVALGSALAASAQTPTPVPAPPADNAKVFNYTLGAYPYAHFEHVAGHVGEADGGLFSFDAKATYNKHAQSVDLGASIWMANSGNTLYDIHAVNMLTRDIGLRSGYLTTSDQHFTAWNALAVYNFSSIQYAPKSRHAWSVQTGIGIVMEPDHGQSYTGITGYVSGLLSVGKKLDLVVTYWYQNDASLASKRYLVGLDKHF